jgi:hypothetical protein
MEDNVPSQIAMDELAAEVEIESPGAEIMSKDIVVELEEDDFFWSRGHGPRINGFL